MSTDAELFEEGIAHLGRRLVWDAEDKHVAVHVQRARHIIDMVRSKYPKAPEVYFDFVDNDDVQAAAFEHRTRYFIAVHAGVLSFLHQVFFRMMADRRILRNVGDPDKEEEPDSKPWRPSAGSEVMMPKDIVRRHYAMHLVEIAFAFLVFHELVHIINGHVDYLSKACNIKMLLEFGNLSASVTLSRDRQTMELDADAVATSSLVATMRTRLSDPAMNVGSPTDQFYTDASACAFNMTISLGAFFRLLGGDDTTEGKDLTQLTHPPILSRYFNVLATVATCVMERWNRNLIQEMVASSCEGMVQVERSLELIGYPNAFAGILYSSQGPGRAYTDSLLQHWKNELRGRLLPHAYADLPE